MGILDGKRILVAGVTTDASIGFAAARVAQELGVGQRAVRRAPGPRGSDGGQLVSATVHAVAYGEVERRPRSGDLGT